VSPVEYADGKRSFRAYIAVCLKIHCNRLVKSVGTHLHSLSRNCKWAELASKTAWNPKCFLFSHGHHHKASLIR